MKWRDPNKDRPKSGDIVAVLFQHNKKHNPRSCEVMFGEAIFYDDEWEVQSDDFTGLGSFGLHFKITNNKEAGHYIGETPIAWMPADEFIIPEWVPHDDWWDESNDRPAGAASEKEQK